MVYIIITNRQTFAQVGINNDNSMQDYSATLDINAAWIKRVELFFFLQYG
jgi:hypothetical protein